MTLDPALLSPMSAVLAAFLIASASLCGTVIRTAARTGIKGPPPSHAAGESVYADFRCPRPTCFIVAYTRDHIELGGDEQRLVELVNRMRLFAPSSVAWTLRRRCFGPSSRFL